MFNYIVYSLSEMMCEDYTYWWVVRHTCELFYRLHGNGIQIPDDQNPDGAIRVFEETKVFENACRFVPYILWLTRQPDSFGIFCELLRLYRPTVDACMTNLNARLVSR